VAVVIERVAIEAAAERAVIEGVKEVGIGRAGNTLAASRTMIEVITSVSRMPIVRLIKKLRRALHRRPVNQAMQICSIPGTSSRKGVVAAVDEGAVGATVTNNVHAVRQEIPNGRRTTIFRFWNWCLRKN